MRHAPGPALPVGTVGLDEYFDVWLTEYLRPSEVLVNLQHASARDLDVIGASYVDPKAKGLQATHTHETYEVLLFGDDLIRREVEQALIRIVKGGTLSVQRKNKQKVYDLHEAVEGEPEVEELSEMLFAVTLHLQSAAQGSIRPELLINAALGENTSYTIDSITRTKLSEGI
jgi:radical SAM-linked protein